MPCVSKPVTELRVKESGVSSLHPLRQQAVPEGCADTMDFGEQSYSMVLADDLDQNGRMDLLVATMNGNLYALETSAVYHPMKAWTSVVSHHSISP